MAPAPRGPRAGPLIDEPRSRNLPDRSGVTGPPGQAGKTVLVVEDNETSRQGLALTLRQAGYHAVAVGNGWEALNRLATDPLPDLIVLDMVMPVLDGWHFLGELRGQGRPPAVPIVITTATSLTLEWANSHGCAGFLRKPVEAGELLAEVARCLGLPR